MSAWDIGENPLSEREIEVRTAGDAKALQISKGPGMNITAEHAGAGESNFDGVRHQGRELGMLSVECR